MFWKKEKQEAKKLDGELYTLLAQCPDAYGSGRLLAPGSEVTRYRISQEIKRITKPEHKRAPFVLIPYQGQKIEPMRPNGVDVAYHEGGEEVELKRALQMLIDHLGLCIEPAETTPAKLAKWEAPDD